MSTAPLGPPRFPSHASEASPAPLLPVARNASQQPRGLMVLLELERFPPHRG